MKTTIILWLLLVIILAGIALVIVYDLRESPEDAPLHSGAISFDYQWLPDDASVTRTIVNPKAVVKTGDKILRDYEITAQNEAFTVRLSVRGVQVDSVRILEARFHGQTQVTVWRDHIVTTPQTSGLTTAYSPKMDIHVPKEKWIEAEILIGAKVLPPYSPLIAVGVSLRRLPLVGKLPPVTVGGGWFGTSPGVYVCLRL
jgi:hypothetical protein